MAGTYADVFASLAHRPMYLEQPAPAGAKTLRRAVWGVQFRVSVEICGPSGAQCETRDGLRTLLIDHASGAKLGTSMYAPSPGDPLPTPLPISD
jgi:hypothetical protein